ncbi:transposase [sulfur-oxidizing endosymbiont of Gigantopelta aegis]|nr:transposase [sulfur-oxidizing endosymbiont of Gigantopelta aegis]
MKKLPPIPEIPEEEKTPVVRLLLAFMEQQQEIIQNQQVEIDALKTEVAKLKKLPPKPKIRASKLPKDDDNDNPTGHSGSKKNNSGNGTSKSRKRKKKLAIHKTTVIKPDNLPEHSRFLGYQDYFVQELLIKPFNTRYRLARYKTPDGDTCIGKLSFDTHIGHFGHTLQSYIVYQYYHQRVTQPLIIQQLTELGFDISTGQINEILIHDKDHFHTEKNTLLTAGINNSTYIHVDDTGSRHDGKNGYCTHVGNETFAWFSSTRYKSRINFLQLLRGAAVDYTLNDAALDYMRAEKLPHKPLSVIEQSHQTCFDNEEAWKYYLQNNSIITQRHVRIATEGALLGA